jgi:predicted type IV restriction endonuclease
LAEIISEKFEASVLNQETAAARIEIPQEEKRIYYSVEEIESLGTFEDFEGVKVVLPNSESYKKLLRIPQEEYSVEKGNPSSNFFISSVLMQGSAIVGYLAGQYSNQQQDTTLYTVKSNESAHVLKVNPIVEKYGFINARLGSRFNKHTNEIAYYLKSCLNNLSFRNIPNLVSKVDDIEGFFGEIQ